MHPAETDKKPEEKNKKNEALDDFTFVLNSVDPRQYVPYHDTRIDFSRLEKEIPEKIRQMRLLASGNMTNIYDFTLRKARIFYVQAKFMEDYEDDLPWNEEVRLYAPSYQDLSNKQLRGYFTWRSRIRKGEYEKNADAFAYIYIFELLNGIGVQSPEESIEKLLEFEKKYAGETAHSMLMQRFIRQWIFEFAVVNGMEKERLLCYADPEDLKRDHVITVLKEPEKYENREIFEAMCAVAGKKYFSSSVVKKLGKEGMDYFAGAWKFAADHALPNGRNLFDKCFGTFGKRSFYPLNGTLYYPKNQERSADHALNECRIFSYDPDSESWYLASYRKTVAGTEAFSEFMRCADRLLRVYLKTGRELQEKQDEKWAVPLINSFIEADRLAKEEAKKVKVSIDFSNLNKIRSDAVKTCDSLLTEEEKTETADEVLTEKTEIPHEENLQKSPEIPLDATQLEILKALLDGRSVAGIIAKHHGMPEICADSINEAFFDEVGDNVVECDGKEIVLVEDYREEVAHLIGSLKQQILDKSTLF